MFCGTCLIPVLGARGVFLGGDGRAIPSRAAAGRLQGCAGTGRGTYGGTSTRKGCFVAYGAIHLGETVDSLTSAFFTPRLGIATGTNIERTQQFALLLSWPCGVKKRHQVPVIA